MWKCLVLFVIFIFKFCQLADYHWLSCVGHLRDWERQGFWAVSLYKSSWPCNSRNRCLAKQWVVCFFQVTMKKRMVYGGIAFIWIFAFLLEMTLGVLSSNIVKGTCIPWGAYSSYAAEKSITFMILFTTYLLPLMAMLFCYYRIVYTLKHKVSLTSWWLF